MKNVIPIILISILVFNSCVAEKTAINATGKLNTVSPTAQNRVIVVDFQKEFLKQINKTRAEGCKCGDVYMPPVDPLTWNTELHISALAHAKDMAKNKYFSHLSKNGDKIKDRITTAGYTYAGYQSFTIGENIAFNQRSIREVMEGWLNSPAHCKNIMSSAFKEVGIGMQDYYWVQDFGGKVPFQKNLKR